MDDSIYKDTENLTFHNEDDDNEENLYIPL